MIAIALLSWLQAGASLAGDTESRKNGVEGIGRFWPIEPRIGLGVAAWAQEYTVDISATGDAAGIGAVSFDRNSPESPIWMDFALGLFGPDLGIAEVPIRPFLRAGVLLPTNGENTVLSKLAQTEGVVPRLIDNSRLVVQWSPIWAAGAGVEVELPGDLGIRLSPSLEFRRMRVEYAGSFSRLRLQGTQQLGEASITAEEDSTQLYLGPALTGSVGFDPFGGVIVSASLDVAILADLSGARQRFSAADDEFGTVAFEVEGGRVAAEVGMSLVLSW